MLNQFNGMGRLSKDPEPRQTNQGKPFLTFQIACERDYKNQEGRHDTDWLSCVAFGQTADFLSRYAKKGSMICVTGRVQVREWSDDNGVKKQKTEIAVNSAYVVGSPAQQHENGYQPGQGGYPQGYGGGYQSGGYQGGYRP